jgi:predicted nucleic acid-binding protein
VTGGFLLDTNVISATAPDRRTVPEPAKRAARAWIVANRDDLHLPVTAIAEITAGIGLREASGAIRHAVDLAAWLRTVIDLYPERILAMDLEAALHARALARKARAAGVAVGFADLTVACIAQRHRLTVVTRNVRDFAPMGIETVDPFVPD